jgi:hypothetical protein
LTGAASDDGTGIQQINHLSCPHWFPDLRNLNLCKQRCCSSFAHPKVMASSTEEARLLELYELQNNEGPCLDCYRTGLSAARAGLPAMHTAWPAFTPRLEQLGFHCAQALPLRLLTETIGALNLFRTEPGPVSCSPPNSSPRSPAGSCSNKPKACSPNAPACPWTKPSS